MTYDNDPSHNIRHIHHVQSKWYNSEVIYELTTSNKNKELYIR